MRASGALFAFWIMTAGCGGGNVYPNTDVVEPISLGLEPKIATGFTYMPGGLLGSGHMEYEGPGDLIPIFRSYIEHMKGQGWVPLNTDVQNDKAVGTLRKDTRSCTLTFTQASGRVRAIIIVGQPK